MPQKLFKKKWFQESYNKEKDKIVNIHYLSQYYASN